MIRSKKVLMALSLVALALIAALGLAGCGSPPEVISEEHGEAQPLVNLATADLQGWLTVSSDEIAVQSVEATGTPPGLSDLKDRPKLSPPIGSKAASTPTSPPTPAPVYQEVNIPEAGLVFEVPAGWLRLEPEWAWAPDGANSLRLGVTWMDVQPPQEVEAALLPTPSQVIDSEPVELGWASGRRFTVEVYAPAVQGDGTRAPVQSVEMHVILVVSLGDTRRAIDFYAIGQTAEQLAILEPSLQHMLETSILAD